MGASKAAVSNGFERLTRIEMGEPKILAPMLDSAWLLGCPRPELNQRTRFRKPLLYPLSYGGFVA